MSAALRGIDILLSEGMNVKVVTFPDGDDPDSYSKKVSSTELQKYVRENAQDFLAFKSDLLSEEAGDDPLKRSELVHSIVTTLACVQDAIQRSIYIQTIAARLKLPEDLLQGEVAKELQKRLVQDSKRSKQFQKSSIPRQTSSPRTPFPGDTFATQVEDDLAPGIPARVRAKRDVLEDNLIRLLLEHGEAMVEVEIEAQDEKDTEGQEESVKEPVYTKVTFAELLVHRMETLQLSMEEDSTQFILSKYIESLDDGALPTSASFFTDASPEVQSKAANSIIHKYSLSENWENKHHIFSVVEEDVLEESLSSATTRLLLFDVQRNIDKIIQALALKDVSDDETTRLLREKISLDRMVKDLNSSLGVIILPK